MISSSFQGKKRQKYLSWIVLIVILAGALWFGRGFLIKPGPPPPSPPEKKTIEMSFELFNNPAFQELQSFEEIPPFEGEVGRENPFIAQ